MGSKLISKITEETSIQLGIVIILIGGIFWLSTLYSTTEANSKSLEEIKMAQSEYSKNLYEINIRLARIEGLLKNNSAVYQEYDDENYDVTTVSSK